MHLYTWCHAADTMESRFWFKKHACFKLLINGQPFYDVIGMEMDDRQDRGMLRADNSPREELSIDDDVLRPEEESEEDTLGGVQRNSRLQEYRSTITLFFEENQKVYQLLRLITLMTSILCFLCLFMDWGKYMAAIGLLNNLELTMAFKRETSELVSQKTSFYICRCIVVVIMKPMINVVICMLGGNLCWFTSPDHIGAELPLVIALASIAQVFLLRMNRELVTKGQQPVHY